MPDIKDVIRNRLVKLDTPAPVQETMNTPRFGWDNPKYDNLETPVRAVMEAYQNANRWMDTIKEHLLINLHCPYFSNIVHQLAHTMPARFDQFGDILHTENLEIPYPRTEEWNNSLPDIKSCIYAIYDMLDAIRKELTAFKRTAEDLGLYALSISCDPLVTDISSEYEFYYRVEDMLSYYGSNVPQWDKRCYEYYKNKSELI